MERTKTAIVETFQQVLEETPINKITVKTIVERCGINRNTFYYYFDGIPDLLECHMTELVDQLFASFEQPNPVMEMQQLVNYFAQNKKSVLHVYRYLPREEFLAFLDKLSVYVVQKSLVRVTEGVSISEEDMTILTRYYKSSLVGVLLDWLEAGMSYDMSAMVTRIYELMNGSTRAVIEKMEQNIVMA